jgi:hypothetical protein
VNAENRASVNDGRYVPANPWVYFRGRRYRVRGDRVETFYYLFLPGGGERAIYRDIDPSGPTGRAVRRLHAKRGA